MLKTELDFFLRLTVILGYRYSVLILQEVLWESLIKTKTSEPIELIMKSCAQLYVIIPILLVLSACSVCNEQKNTEFEKAALIEGRNYYLFEEGYSCRSNTPEKTEILSWKNKLEVKESQLMIWGTLCNDQIEILPFDKKALKISPDGVELIYQNKTYLYRENQPKLCDQGLWCPIGKTSE